MQDQNDSFTHDLLSTHKRRGRPPSGKALSPSQRKAAQRMRDLSASLECMTVTGILSSLGVAVSSGDSTRFDQCVAELRSRLS